ncbi:MAG: autotransporter outer membrane beta-barrel domain-containing protein [Akkermansia sp.]|nr:autotransporter outer membrane beta-barrel domain-containing protein [Akkermansia sp.]
MKLHLPHLLRAAVLACLAAFPVANATTLVANGVNPNNITSSTRFFDNGKGYYWQAMGQQPWRGAGQLFNQFGNFSFMGELQRRLRGNTMSLDTFAPLLDDENTCWYNVSANVFTYWESVYGVFADSSRTLPYGYTYDKQYMDDLGGTQSLRVDMLFYDTWTNYNGQEAADGDFMMIAPWYLADNHEYTSIGGPYSVLRNDSTKGGYFSQWFPKNNFDATVKMYRDMDGNLPDLKAAADALIDAFGAVDNGDGTYSHTAEGQIAFIGIVAPGGAGHAMTSYGFETNPDGTLKSILFANSDDMEYRTFTLYTGMQDGKIFLFEDEGHTTLWTYGQDERGVDLTWSMDEVEFIPTPVALKELANQYNHGQLTWSGIAESWKPAAAQDPDVALPTADGGWMIPVNGETYAAAYTDGRSVAFTDAAADSTYEGRVNLGATLTVPEMTINNAAVDYVFDGAGTNTLRAERLVKEGTGSATFTNTDLFSPELQVKGGKLVLGTDSRLGGDSNVAVESGSLVFDGGYADISGSITATGGEVAVMRGTAVNAPSLTIGADASLSLSVTQQQLTSTLLAASGNVSVNGLIRVNFEDTDTHTVVTGQAYKLISTTGSLSVPNPENLLVTSVSIPDIDTYDAVLSVEGGTLNLVFTKGLARYWAGGVSGTWNKAEDNIVWAEERGGAPTSFYDSNYYAAHFEGGSGVTNITVGEEINLTEWNVSGAEYHFTGADKVVPSKRIVVANGGTMVVDKAPQGANIPLIVEAGSSFTMTGDDTFTLWTLENAGTIDIAAGSLALRSGVENGGYVHVGKDLALAAGSDNAFDELHVDGSVSYSGTAGVLRAGGNSVIGSVAGGILQARDAEGSVTLTTDGTSTLSTIQGPGSIHALGSLHLTGETNYTSTLTVDGEFSLDAATTITNLTAGYIKPADGAVLTVTGELNAAQLEVASIITFDSPQYYAATLTSPSMEFRPTVAAWESVKSFGFLSGDTIYLLRNISEAPSMVSNLTLTGGASFYELNDGKNHVARIAQNGNGDVVLSIGVIDTLQWVSEDGVWSSFRDWDSNGTEFTEPAPATPIGFLGEGTSIVDINGDRTVKSILLESVNKNYTLEGEGTLATQDINVNGGYHTIGDGERQLRVEVAKTVTIGSRAALTITRNTRLTADSISAVGSSVAISNDGQVRVRDISAASAIIRNSGSITLETASVSAIVGNADTQAQAGDITITAGGQLNLAKDSRIGYLENGGTVNIASAKLTLLQETTQGGEMNAGTLNLTAGNNAFSKLVAYTVNGNSGSLYMGGDSNIQNLNGAGSLHLTGGYAEVDNPGYDLQNLSIADDASLRFGATDSPLVPTGHFKGIADVLPQEYLWTEIHGTFSSGGDLVSNRSLVFDKKVANGGNLTAPAVALSSTGNVFGDLITDTIVFTSAPSAAAPMVYVNRLANYSEDITTITLGLEEVPELAGAYELIDGCGITAAESCTLSSDALSNLRREHLNGELVVRDDDLWINIKSMGDNHYPEITDGNAGKGAQMASEAYFELSPQLNRDQYPDLAKALDGLDHLVSSHRADADKLASAVAGASIPALHEAIRGDVDRQLRAIRNRTTTMGINSCCATPKDLPYVNAWINAEGDYRRMEHDKSLSGYKYNTWGGTVGVDLDVTSNTTAGLAVTAMFGDFKSDAADHLDGDLDNYYLTAFVRHSNRSWVHTFIATLGRADADVDRTVSTPYGAYATTGSTTGSSFGLMYEVARTYALTEDSSACIQPILNVTYIHTSMDGYTEGGSDAALKVEDIDSNAVNIAVGARVQTAFGADVYNRSSVFEGRALVKGYLADRDSCGKVQFAQLGALSNAEVRSAERGPLGLELGAGIYIPVSLNAGSIFWDASLELRTKDMNINTTIGYRYNF